MELQRYEPIWIPNDRGSVKMDADCEGNWYKVEDVKPLLSQRELIQNGLHEWEALVNYWSENDRCRFCGMPFKGGHKENECPMLLVVEDLEELLKRPHATPPAQNESGEGKCKACLYSEDGIAFVGSLKCCKCVYSDFDKINYFKQSGTGKSFNKPEQGE